MSKTTSALTSRARQPRKMARPPEAAPSEAAASEPTAPAGPPPAASVAVPAPSPAPQTKAALVLGLLHRPEGATLPELVEATGWLPHTVRAHLTGLRKKGNVVARTQRGDATCYHIAEAL